MKLWIIDKRLGREEAQFEDNDLIIDFFGQLDSRHNLLDLSERYNKLRGEIRDKYIQYISALGNRTCGGKTLKELFLIENSSLWWFNGISQKDSFTDPLFDDICKTILIKMVLAEKGITSIKVFTESPWLEHLLLNRKKRILIHVLKKLFSRIKLAIFYYPCIKVFLGLQMKQRAQPREGDTLFFSFFPGAWNIDKKGQFSDRFYRELPMGLKGAAYLIFLEDSKKVPEDILRSSIVIQDYVGIKDILKALFDLRNAFRYFMLRGRLKKFFIFEGTDLSAVFDWYMWESVLFEEAYFRLIINGVSKIVKVKKPKQIVTVDEFGYLGRSIVVGAKTFGVKVIWLQHAVISRGKLWFFYQPLDFAGENKDDHDFIRFLPICDSYILWADADREDFSRYGFPSDRMIVLGNPRYDCFLEIKERLGQKLQNIVLAPSIHIVEAMIFCDLAIRIKKHFPEKSVVLKLHPRYKELIRDRVLLKEIELLKKFSVKIATDSVENYYSDLSLFVCRISTVGIEAAYFGAKAISYIPRYHNIFVPEWLEKDTYVSSFEELIEKINNFQEIPRLNWSRYYLPPGEAKDKVAKFLESNCRAPESGK